MANSELRGSGSRNRGRISRITFCVLRLVCFALLALLLGRRAYAVTPPPIVINELQYHPASDNHGEEYIELYNAGTVSADLSDWAFSDGIDYSFPAGVTLAPGAYLVIAHDPATVEARYGITGTLGPFLGGKLANEGERVALEDAVGALVDEVTYDDHLPWPEAADGDGPSLELINPGFDNDSPCSWGSSAGLGTPGAQNSVYLEGNIPPCIVGTAHAPAFPRSTEPITVTAYVSDNSAVVSVTLHYRRQGESAYHTLPMAPAVVNQESGIAEYAVSGAQYVTFVPPQPANHYVEFYVTATDDEAAVRIAPEGAPGGVSAETGLPITVSYLAWVEDTSPTSAYPLYRLVLTQENRAELLTRDIFSNVLLDATFVYGNEVFYNVGLRYRGESSRDMTPRPYRIKFRDAQEFESRERINLVSDNMGKEALAHDLFRRAGLPAADTRFVTFYVNGAKEGDYLDVENVDRDFLKAHFGSDNDGNLYRGYDGADLRYRGPDPNSYRPYYLKKTNEDADDYTDVISLTYTLTSAPDATLLAEADVLADMRQWLKWFAVQAVLDNHEGALWIGQGDDYFLYHRSADDRFILISWDHDTTFSVPDHTIWEPDWYAGEIVRRILHYTIFTRWYYQGIAEVIAGPFSAAEMNPRIDALPDSVSQAEKDKIRNFVAARIPSLWAQIPGDTLLIATNNGRDIVTSQDVVTLEGTCSPLRDATVNGGTAGLTYLTPVSWRYTAQLTHRDNVFVFSDGQDTRTITIFKDTFHGGTLTEDTLLETSRLPYSISQDIQLSGAITLTIQPGVTLKFESDRVIRVENGAQLLAEGTAQQPIVFTGRDGVYWGGILFYNTQADNRIGHAVVEYVHEVITTPRTHGVTGYSSRFTVADSTLRAMRRSNAIIADYSSTLYLLRNDIYDIGSDAIHATGGYAYIQGNAIHDLVYDPNFNPAPPEGMEISHMEVTPAVLLDNRIYNIPDDCIDLNYSSAIIERNILHHCGDKGISVGSPSSTTLVNNLVYECRGSDADPNNTGFGIAVKDGAVAHIVNNTLVNNRHGLGLYQAHAGAGGGAATVVNTIIWGNQVNIELRDGSSLTASYSDIEGGWPGDENLAVDPLFRAPGGHVYRLQEESPCVDTGTAVGAPDVDVMGVWRPHGAGYDRGAYEFFEFFSAYLPAVMRLNP